MKPIHILGLGTLIGFLALGGLVAVAGLRWSESAFPAASAPGVTQPAAQAAAPVSADVTAGETIFKQKCSSCHTIGGGRLVGPDLKGVTTQRPHDWLINFITAPDKVIASGDPTATQLVKEYGAPMPNLGVTTQQAEQILAYIQYQTGGATPAPVAAQPTGVSVSVGAQGTATAGPVEHRFLPLPWQRPPRLPLRRPRRRPPRRQLLPRPPRHQALLRRREIPPRER